MNKKIVLLGTKAAGKTTMLSIMRGENPPEDPKSTDGHTDQDRYTIGGWWIFGDKIEMHDTGGKNTNTEGDYKEWIKESDYVIFVFDGREFINEMDSTEGGIIGTKIRNWVLPVFMENEKPLDNLIFVATHMDIYGNEMRQSILNKMKEVNKVYDDIVHTKRYTFDELMNNNSNFYCVDSRNEEQIKKMFNDIKSR